LKISANFSNVHIGAILVYNGRPDTGISLKPSQIILASQKKKNSPVFFGFSLQTGFDIDGNGYDGMSTYLQAPHFVHKELYFTIQSAMHTSTTSHRKVRRIYVVRENKANPSVQMIPCCIKRCCF